jgi:stage V sporulation protein S
MPQPISTTARHRVGQSLHTTAARQPAKQKQQSNGGVLRASSRSNPTAIAGALAGTVRERGRVEIQTIGAGALNQAIKAVAIARGFLAPGGIDLVCRPAFVDVEIDGNKRTAIKLSVEPARR